MNRTPRDWANLQTDAPKKLKALLHQLATYANAKGIAYPSQAAICGRIGWSKGTLKKWSDLGRALGLFSTKKRFNPKKGHCDAMIYSLHLDRVVTLREVQRQIAKLRFESEANRKNGGGKSQKGKSQKQGFASGKGKSQSTANNSTHESYQGKAVVKELVPDGEVQRDWLRVDGETCPPADWPPVATGDRR